MKSFYVLTFFMLFIASSLFGQTLDFYLHDIHNENEFPFNSIEEYYDIDMEKPTILIAYNKPSTSVLSLADYNINNLINRYNLCDPELINVITVSYGNSEMQGESWDNCLNFAAEVSPQNKSLKDLVITEDLPAFLFILNGEVLKIEKKKLIYPVHHAFNNYFGSYEFETLFFHSSSVDMMQYALVYYENIDDTAEYRTLIPYFDYALQIDPDPIDYSDIIKYAEMLYTIGESEKAKDIASKYYRSKKAGDTGYKNWRPYAMFLMSTDDTEALKEVFSDINIALDESSSPVLFIHLASMRNKEKDNSRSFVKRYCKSISLEEVTEMSLYELYDFSKSEMDYHLLLSVLYLEAGMPDSACSYARETLYKPDDFDALVYLTCILLDGNNLKEAEKIAQKAAELTLNKSQKDLIKSLIKEI